MTPTFMDDQISAMLDCWKILDSVELPDDDDIPVNGTINGMTVDEWLEAVKAEWLRSKALEVHHGDAH